MIPRQHGVNWMSSSNYCQLLQDQLITKVATVAIIIKLYTQLLYVWSHYVENDDLKHYYTSKSSRFHTGEDTWPPDQSKHFTPVVMIRQKCRQSNKKTEFTAAVAINKDCIEKFLSMTTNKATKDLQEVFYELEQHSDNQDHCIMLVEGSPGIGKSMLLKHTAYLWAKGRLLTNKSFLFLLHF